jgi:thiol:disulfide interchange protein DsbD
VRSHGAASLAVKLGYKNIYRFAEGLPAWKEMGLPIESGRASYEVSGGRKGISTVAGTGLILTLIGIFFGGIALNLTPCVYPLIPITASYFGGRSETGERQGYLILHGFLYILGLSFMNSALGISAAFTGKLMGSVLQHPAVLIFVSSVLLLMALNFFGLWELRLPFFLSSVVSKSHRGYAQSLFMGLTLGIVAAPCIGPFIIGLLTMVAQKGNPLYGFLIFFTLSIGIGLPLLILSLFAGNLNKLPRSGEWMLWIRNLFGWIMLVMAVYFIKPLFPWRDAGTFIIAFIALASGVYLGFINKTGKTLRVFVTIKKIFGIVVIGLSLFFASSVLLRKPGVSWQSYSQDMFSQAKAAGKPIIIDFYADWCTPCRQLDKETFHDQDVTRESLKFTMTKVDLTKEANPDVIRLLQEYNIKGVPTVIFLDSHGQELRELQIVDYISGKAFLLRMNKTLEEESKGLNR